MVKFWRPKTIMRLETDGAETAVFKRHPGREVFAAWLPYLLLVVFVLAWGYPPIKTAIDTWTQRTAAVLAAEKRDDAQRTECAGVAQSDHSSAAGHGATGSLCRRLYAELAQRIRNGVFVRDACGGDSSCG